MSIKKSRSAERIANYSASSSIKVQRLGFELIEAMEVALKQTNLPTVDGFESLAKWRQNLWDKRRLRRNYLNWCSHYREFGLTRYMPPTDVEIEDSESSSP